MYSKELAWNINCFQHDLSFNVENIQVLGKLYCEKKTMENKVIGKQYCEKLNVKNEV